MSGLWPLVHMRSFEMVLGTKTDHWLVNTVGGLLIANGLMQVATSPLPGSVRQARLLGVGTAAVLAAVDVGYVFAGRISRVYLVDPALEAGWIVAWARARTQR